MYSILNKCKPYAHTFLSWLCRSKWAVLPGPHHRRLEEVHERSTLICFLSGRCLNLDETNAANQTTTVTILYLEEFFLKTEKKRVKTTPKSIFSLHTCKFVLYPDCFRGTIFVYRDVLKEIMGKALLYSANFNSGCNKDSITASELETSTFRFLKRCIAFGKSSIFKCTDTSNYQNKLAKGYFFHMLSYFTTFLLKVKDELASIKAERRKQWDKTFPKFYRLSNNGTRYTLNWQSAYFCNVCCRVANLLEDVKTFCLALINCSCLREVTKHSNSLRSWILVLTVR